MVILLCYAIIRYAAGIRSINVCYSLHLQKFGFCEKEIAPYGLRLLVAEAV